MSNALKAFGKYAAGLTVAGAVAASAGAAEVTMRIAHLNPSDPTQSHSATMAAVFKNLVETASDGEIEVSLYPNGQLGEDHEVLAQVRAGVVESSISSAGGIAQHYPMIGIFDMPFAFPDIGVATDVITLDSAFGQALADDLLEETGLRTLGLLDSGGFFQLTNSQRPIESVADMERLRIRTMTLPTHEEMMDALGARPTPLPWAEVYTALQTGVADGQMNPIQQTAFAKFQEVQDYLTISNHLITPYLWVINDEFYDGLSDEHREIVDWASRIATDAGRSTSRLIEASDQGLPQLAEGMEVNTLSEEAREEFAELTQPKVQELIERDLGEKGAEMLEMMMQSIDDAVQARR